MVEQRATFLSEYVEKLVCWSPYTFQNKREDTGESTILSEEGLIHWDQIKEFNEELESIDFCYAVQKIMPVGFASAHFLKSHDIDVIFKCYQDLITWTNNSKIIRECIVFLKSYPNDKVNLILQLISSVLEKALGDLVLTKERDCSHCVIRLRTLLKCSVLKSIIGPKAIYLLWLLVGPPQGLNLRNLAWHGFPLLGELSIEYAAFLIVLVPSIGNLLRTAGHLQINHRKTLQLAGFADTIEERLYNISAINRPSLKEDVVNRLFKASYFVPPGMIRSWMLASQLYFEERLGYSIVALLPLLEHGLRCLFCVANECDRRIRTAEAEKQFTTFSEIFAAELPDNKKNALPDLLGPVLWNMLIDVFQRAEGPRLRDRLSHGELNIHELDPRLIHHTWIISICICCKYTLPFGDRLIGLDKRVKDFTLFSEVYVPIFHPFGLLSMELENSRRKLVTCLNEYSNLDQNGGLSISETDSDGEKIEEARNRLFKAFVHEGKELIDRREQMLEYTDIRSNFEIDCNFHEELDGEVTGLLRQIVTNILKSAEQLVDGFTEQYRMYKAKQLRSRGRKTFATLQKCYPRVMDGLIILLAVVASGAELLVCRPEQIDASRIRYFKKCLQFAENIQSMTSPTKNRWLEAVTLILKLCSFVQPL